MNNQYIRDQKISSEFIEQYSKSNYRIIGEHKHSAVKPCHWLEQRLMTGRENRNCYKGVFGVESHRCLQNTPSYPFCNHQCVFCWRDIEKGSLGGEFAVEPDEPRDLVEEMIRHQKNILKNHLTLRRYLDNYEIMIDILHFMLLRNKAQSIDTLYKGIHVSKTKIERALNLLKNQAFLRPINEDLSFFEVDRDIDCCIENRDEIETLVNRALTSPEEIIQAHCEALEPNHAAISLDGEPLLYPKISDLVEEFRKREMTSFIVTNSTCPQKVSSMDFLPSQFYFTLPAPNEKIYKKTCRPMIKNGWQRIQESLGLIDSLSCRTLIRLTAVKNLNLKESYIKDYIKIVEEANPNFFEIKGFTLQAKALKISKRLKSQDKVTDYFPDYDYLYNLAEKFEEMSSFSLIYTNKASRDFLFAVNWDKNKDPVITNP